MGLYIRGAIIFMVASHTLCGLHFKTNISMIFISTHAIKEKHWQKNLPWQCGTDLRLNT